jgi:hypothetical protein
MARGETTVARGLREHPKKSRRVGTLSCFLIAPNGRLAPANRFHPHVSAAAIIKLDFDLGSFFE